MSENETIIRSIAERILAREREAFKNVLRRIEYVVNRQTWAMPGERLDDVREIVRGQLAEEE